MLFFYCKKEGLVQQIELPEKGCWINAETATSQDLDIICRITSMQMADLADALDYHELPRLEKSADHIILFTRHPIQQEGHLHTIPILVLLTNDYFMTISPSKSLIIEELLHKNDPPFLPSELLVQILQRICIEFSTQIRKARHGVMDQGTEMDAASSEDISSLTEKEEILNQYLSSLDHLQSAIKELLKVGMQSFHPQAHHEIDDILNSIRQSETLCNTLIKNIRSLRDSYQILFTNKLTKTIKLLTALTIIFSIPNMIASIYGMNVRLPFAEGTHAFFILMLLMFLISALCGYWFYRKKWL